MKKFITSLGAGLLAFSPALALAQLQGSSDIVEFTLNITDFINTTLIPLIFAVALVVFIWGMFRFFILGGHNDDEKAKGKSLMLWAIIGFVLMVSIWGIVNVIANGLGFSGDTIQDIPVAPTQRGG